MWATHRVFRNGSRPVSGKDDIAGPVVRRTNDIVIRTLAFEAESVRHSVMMLKSLGSWRDRGLEGALIYLLLTTHKFQMSLQCHSSS